MLVVAPSSLKAKAQESRSDPAEGEYQPYGGLEVLHQVPASNIQTGGLSEDEYIAAMARETKGQRMLEMAPTAYAWHIHHYPGCRCCTLFNPTPNSAQIFSGDAPNEGGERTRAVFPRKYEPNISHWPGINFLNFSRQPEPSSNNGIIRLEESRLQEYPEACDLPKRPRRASFQETHGSKECGYSVAELTGTGGAQTALALSSPGRETDCDSWKERELLRVQSWTGNGISHSTLDAMPQDYYDSLRLHLQLPRSAASTISIDLGPTELPELELTARPLSQTMGYEESKAKLLSIGRT